MFIMTQVPGMPPSKRQPDQKTNQDGFFAGKNFLKSSVELTRG